VREFVGFAMDTFLFCSGFESCIGVRIVMCHIVQCVVGLRDMYRCCCGSIIVVEALPDDAMQHLDISDKMTLVKSPLYLDHSKHRILDQFDSLKRDHDRPHVERVRDAHHLLEQINNMFKGELGTVDSELEFCITMLGCTDEKAKWQYFFDTPIHMKWINEWTTPGPIISSVFPWFNSDHDWTAMRPETYLKGAKQLVGAYPLFAKIAHPNARFVIEEVTRWNPLVNNDDCVSFLDTLHLELSAMRLGIVIPDEGHQDLTVPSSLTIDIARQLLKPQKGKCEKPCKNYPVNGAFIALLTFVGRTAHLDGVGG